MDDCKGHYTIYTSAAPADATSEATFTGSLPPLAARGRAAGRREGRASMTTQSHPDLVVRACDRCRLMGVYLPAMTMCLFCQSGPLVPVPGVLPPPGIATQADITRAMQYDPYAEAPALRLDDGETPPQLHVPVHRPTGRPLIRWAAFDCPNACGCELHYYVYRYTNGDYATEPMRDPTHDCETTMDDTAFDDAWNTVIDARVSGAITTYYQMPGALGCTDPEDVDDPD